MDYLFIYTIDISFTFNSHHMSAKHQTNTVIDIVTESLIGKLLPELLKIIGEYDDCEERKLINCNCCVRHNIGRPTSRHSIYISSSSGLNEEKKETMCRCACRTTLRRSSVDAVDCLYYILPYYLINIITQYVDVDNR
jgi:hypothetical protein